MNRARQDNFLDEWLAILAAERRDDVRRRIAEIIDRDRQSTDFEVSIKATLIAGHR